MKELELKYGCNPNQKPSRIFMNEGEPAPVAIEGDIDAFTSFVWENLNEDNKVSLFVRYIDIATGAYESRIVNKNK